MRHNKKLPGHFWLGIYIIQWPLDKSWPQARAKLHKYVGWLADQK